jgi:hypothetical protein
MLKKSADVTLIILRVADLAAAFRETGASWRVGVAGEKDGLFEHPACHPDPISDLDCVGIGGVTK